MNANLMRQLVKQAHEDPAFFHSLVFAPEKALASLDHLDSTARAALRTVNPEQFIGRLVGGQLACGGDTTCSCTSGTCGDTCGGSTCDVTCSGDSCGSTCGDSCGYTTNIVRNRFQNTLTRF